MADVTGDYVQMDQVGWVDFPRGYVQRGIGDAEDLAERADQPGGFRDHGEQREAELDSQRWRGGQL